MINIRHHLHHIPCPPHHPLHSLPPPPPPLTLQQNQTPCQNSYSNKTTQGQFLDPPLCTNPACTSHSVPCTEVGVVVLCHLRHPQKPHPLLLQKPPAFLYKRHRTQGSAMHHLVFTMWRIPLTCWEYAFAVLLDSSKIFSKSNLMGAFLPGCKKSLDSERSLKIPHHHQILQIP